MEKEMDLDNEKQKKKQKKVIKKKSFRKKSKNVTEVTEMVDGLKVNHGPDIVIEETRSQPGSRRNSSFSSEDLPQRRASNVGINHQSKDAEPHTEDGSIMTRRASVKRGSIFYAEDEEDLEAKKVKAALNAMGLLKKKQKAFTWDTQTTTNKKIEDVKNKWKRPGKNAVMDKDTALKTLGLLNTSGGVTKPRDIRDYSEDEILKAFQKQCTRLSKYALWFYYMKFNKFSSQAQAGKMIELQDCHEAYQVLLKVVKAHGNKKKEKEESEAS